MASREEIKVSGLNAVLALAKRRSDDLVRVYLVEERVRELGDVLKACAAARKAYHIVPADELEKIAETVHHEGVVALAKQKRAVSFTSVLERSENAKGPITIVFLDGVKNPHNLGAILRTAAHFGVRFLIASGEESLPPSLHRTAEGGLESVDVAFTSDPPRALKALSRKGFRIYGTSSRARASLFGARFAERSVLLLGAEAEGVPEASIALCDEVLSIPGSGEVESLNVSAAAAIVLAEAWRSRAREPVRPAVSRRGPRDRARTRGSPSR